MTATTPADASANALDLLDLLDLYRPRATGRGCVQTHSTAAGGYAVMEQIDPPQAQMASDAPIGRTITVPCGVTGKPLSYFTPDPLSDLLTRYLQSAPFEPSTDSIYSPLLLLRAAARSSHGHVDLKQANRFLSIMLGQQGHHEDGFLSFTYQEGSISVYR